MRDRIGVADEERASPGVLGSLLPRASAVALSAHAPNTGPAMCEASCSVCNPFSNQIEIPCHQPIPHGCATVAAVRSAESGMGHLRLSEHHQDAAATSQTTDASIGDYYRRQVLRANRMGSLVEADSRLRAGHTMPGPPRWRPSVQEMVSPRAIPDTCLPRLRSSTGRQGTKVNSRLFSITAKRPLARSSLRR